MLWWWPRFKGDDHNAFNFDDKHNFDDNNYSDDDDDDEGEDDDIVHSPTPPDHWFKPQAYCDDQY